MRWKKRPSGVFLFLTLLHCALCNHHSHDKHGKRKGEHSSPNEVSDTTRHTVPAIPGIAITQLEDLSFLDPYNLIDGKSYKSKDRASILHEIIPMGESGHAFSKKKDRTSRKKGVNSNSSKYSVGGILKDPEKSTSLSSHSNSNPNRPSRGRKLPPYEAEDSNADIGKDRSNSERDEDSSDVFGTLDYDDMHDFGENVGDVTDASQSHRKKSAYTRVEADRNVLLHEAVRKLLGFSSSPDLHDVNSRRLPDPTREKRLPRYVKDLYERFQSGQMNAGLVNGNTVRSIHTNIGLVEGESMFLFNLTSLRPSEELLNAEIHLYKRKLKPWVKRLEVDVILYQVAPHYISEAGKIKIRDTASGWQWYDVTNAIRSCLATRDPRPHLFGLSFRAQKSNGKSRSLPLRKFGRHHSMPFLVVYSNETEAVNFDQLDLLAERLRVQNNVEEDPSPDSFSSEEEEEDNVVVYDLDSTRSSEELDEDSEEEESPVASNQYAVANEDLDDSMQIVLSPLDEPDQTKRRQKRSIFTNEIPEDPADFEKYKFGYKIPKTHPGILKARKESRIQLGSSGLIPFPDQHHLQQRRRRRRKNRRRKHRKRFPNKGRRLRFPKEWENFQESLVAKDKSEKDSSNVCGRRKLVVDFADIGWGDWIISPKSFEAHYCAGECPFPLTKRLRPSNHATIQSIVHAIGIYDKVPAPCCVPDVMSSVTLLYFDEDRNVVLKNYPGMTVESCACR